jgi:hypothetical protein
MFCGKCNCEISSFFTYGGQPYCSQCSKEIRANAPKSVIVKFEEEIEDCYECPFKHKVYEQGYSDYVCSKRGAYASIPDDGIRPDCPFRKK